MSDVPLQKIHKPIFVTQPFLPPLEEFISYLEEIWENKILTNGGPLHQRLERELCDYLDVPYISLFNNGTIALITALQALDLSGEVITTPYTFVATTNAILWNNLKPVFVDIAPETLNLDPTLIEAAITPRTSAILPVHCYGTPCDVDAIDAIAKKHHLKVLYDAAHAFGVQCHCGSLLNHGDLSVLSFHATKVFNTFEGGAIVSKSAEMKLRIDRLKNFGLVSECAVIEPGLNGKMSEISAAMGLAQLRYIDATINARSKIDTIYRTILNKVPGITCLSCPIQQRSNYSYFPVLVGDGFGVTRDELLESLNSVGVFPRRYFFPLITQLEEIQPTTQLRPELERAAKRASTVLCLPIFPDLPAEVAEKIAHHISSVQIAAVSK